jgi:molybdopterin/thiamine biosynthesis adenylyltransferase/rhodanese-related sulfurtransferase
VSIDAGSVRFERQRTLAGFGLAGQRDLAAARILVIGAGGLGSSLLPSLAAAGVGEIGIVDDDVVEESNLHRQTMFSLSDVGRLKSEAAADALRRLSPDATVNAHPVRFDSHTAAMLAEDVDLLVDASDTLATRYLANDIAAERGVPLVWGNALGWAGQAGVAWDAKGVDYRDLFPVESSEDDATCALVGVLPTVCAVIGSIMANEVLKLLTDTGEPLLGRVLHFDSRSGSFRELAYRRAPGDRSRQETPMTVTRPMDDPHSLSAPQLRSLLDDGAPLTLLDVREPWEAETARLPNSVLVPLGDLAARHPELSKTARTVIYCHHGVRSADALGYLRELGFGDVSHLSGGIDAWSREIDPAIGRY